MRPSKQGGCAEAFRRLWPPERYFAEYLGFPIHRMLFEVGVDGGPDRRMEVRCAESVEQLEALQLVFDGILHFREANLDARFAQGSFELGEHVRRSHIDAGD